MDSANDTDRCRALTRPGQPCRARPVSGSRYCPAHGGRAGVEKSSRLASIDDVIADLMAKQARLSALLDQAEETGDLVKLFALHSQNASRIGRLLRDRQALADTPADALLETIAQALDELSEELGIVL